MFAKISSLFRNAIDRGSVSYDYITNQLHLPRYMAICRHGEELGVEIGQLIRDLLLKQDSATSYDFWFNIIQHVSDSKALYPEQTDEQENESVKKPTPALEIHRSEMEVAKVDKTHSEGSDGVGYVHFGSTSEQTCESNTVKSEHLRLQFEEQIGDGNNIENDVEDSLSSVAAAKIRKTRLPPPLPLPRKIFALPPRPQVPSPTSPRYQDRSIRNGGNDGRPAMDQSSSNTSQNHHRSHHFLYPSKSRYYSPPPPQTVRHPRDRTPSPNRRYSPKLNSDRLQSARTSDLARARPDPRVSTSTSRTSEDT
ncbi:hypothetical protein BGX20_009645 [Mortierella sp. AD010]|nr:hypothetical protein BGX20_009645 [Mortierella sp. AD010]